MKIQKMAAVLLAVMMCITGLPVSVFAADIDYGAEYAKHRYTFTIGGVHITEAGYYTLEGEKVDTEAEAAVQVTDPANKKIEMVNGTTYAQFHNVFEWEHTDWEKEAIGVYIAGKKVTATGYYNNDGTAASESGPVHVDVENKKITLNNADISLTTSEMTLLEDVKDPAHPNSASYITDVYDGVNGVPGVLVVTEGVYNHKGTSNGLHNWDGYHYWPTGYSAEYKFAAIGIGVMADDETNTTLADWTLELTGENSITVNNSFAKPQQLPSSGRSYLQDAAAYGVFAESNLTLTGSGTLQTIVNNNWNVKNVYNQYPNTNTAGGVWTKGDLSISSGTVEASTSTAAAMEYEGSSMTLTNGAAAIGAEGCVTVSGENTSVTATDSTTRGAALRGGTGVTISDKATVAATSASGMAGVAIMGGASTWDGKEVTISSGASVTATTTSSVAEYAMGVGVAGGLVTISDATVDVDAEAVGIESDTVKIESGTVDVSASSDEGVAIDADAGEIAVGTFNTPVDSEFIAEGSVIVNDTVLPKTELGEYTARIGNTYYTGADGGTKAMQDLAAGQTVWLNVDTAENRDDFELKETFTIMVADGKEYTGTVTGPGVRADIVEGNQEENDGVLYTKYTYTMVVDPEKAEAKVVHADGSETYCRDLFGSNGAIGSYSNPLAEGDTVVVLQDSEATSDYRVKVGFTLDLSGKTVTFNARNTSLGLTLEGTEAAPISVKITDSSTEKTGKIENVWSSTSTVGETVCASDYAEVTIEGGTFSGRTEASGGTLTLTGGTYLREIVADTDGTVIVTENADITECEAYSSGGVLILPGEIGGDCSSTEEDNVSWKIVNANGGNPTMEDLEAGTCKLIISGTGAMQTYRNETAPWFGYNDALTEIVIENGVTSIGQEAFAGMTGFNLTLGASVASIGGWALEDAQINTFNLGTAAPTSLGFGSFDPAVVQNFVVDGANTAYKCEGGVLYSKDGKTLHKGSAAMAKAYTIPEGTEIIQSGAFSGLPLESVHFPKTYTGAVENATQDYQYFQLPKPTAANNGAVFGGWYDNVDFAAGSNDQNGDPAWRVYPAETADNGLTVYALWGYEITYNSGSAETVVTVPSGKLLEDYAPAVGMDGKTFAGWSATEGGAVDTALTATAEATVYAVWETDESFEANYNGITLEAIADCTYTGEAHTPAVFYMKDGVLTQVLASEVDYTNNKNAGTATVTIKNTEPAVTKTFTINKAVFDVDDYTFKGKTVTYDGNMHSLAIAEELPEGVTVSYTYAGEAADGVRDVKYYSWGDGVDMYTVKANFSLDGNYQFAKNSYDRDKTSKTAYLKINPVEVTIAVDDATMYRGEELPTFTYTATGLSESVVLTTEPTLTTTATGNNTGNFLVTASGAVVNNDANNYKITYEEGLLTVGVKVLDAGLSFANGTVTYDGENHTIAVNVEGTLPDSFSIAYTVDGEPFTGASDAGTYEVTATISSTDPAYDPVEPLTATLVITPAKLTVTANDATMTVRGEMPEFTYTVDGLLSDDTLTIQPELSCEADGKSTGKYDIVVIGDETDESGNYVIEYVAGTLTVKARRTASRGNLSSTTTNTTTDTETEVITNPDGSTTAVETKEDGTVTTTETDAEGNTVITVENPDGSSIVTEENKDGSEKVTETAVDGTTTTTETDTDGNTVVTTQNTAGTTVVTTLNSGVTVVTETTAEGEISAEITVPADTETEVVIPVENTDAVEKLIVTGEDGTKTEITDFKVAEGGIVLTADQSCTVEIQKGHTCAGETFTDLDAEAWYHEYVDYVLENGIMNGMEADVFAPDATLTRAMLVTMLYRLAGAPEVTAEGTEWYAGARAWAMETGVSDGTNMEADITREQLVTMLFRYAGAEAGEEDVLTAFSDHDEISGYAVDAMTWAIGAGVIDGMGDGTAAPQNSATRAQTAAIFMRFAGIEK